MQEGRVVAISVSGQKGTKKFNVDFALVREGFGIEGDAHAGEHERQVSLLDIASVEKIRSKGLDVMPGDFAENITSRGIDCRQAASGDTVCIGGQVILEITHIGKTCHQGCVIQQQTGECVMPTEGIFMKVLREGRIAQGDTIRLNHRSRGKTMSPARKVFHNLVVGLCLAVLAACTTVPITGRSQFSFISQQQLSALSRQSFLDLLKKSKLSDDPVRKAMLENAGTRIARATEEFLKESGKEGLLKDYKWEFRLIDEEENINAFAMAGGKVAVYTGIFKIAKTEADLATVIGHEIAHVIANHGGERLSQLLLVQMGGIALSQAMKQRSAETQRIAYIAYGAGATVGAVLPYSRLHEREADRIGLILMARAGYDPAVAVSFWQRMAEESKGLRLPEFLSTHPVPATRIKNIQSYLPEAMKYYK